MMKELKFMTKIFRKCQTETEGKRMGEQLVAYLKSDSPLSSSEEKIAEDILLELETYVPKAKEEDFIWEMVYARRALNKKGTKTKNDPKIVHSWLSACHFERIVAVRPTVHNRSCEVMELTEAAIDYSEIGQNLDAYKGLDLARDKFAAIEKNENAIYYQAGSFMYYVCFKRDDRLKNNDEEKIKLNRTVIDYSCKDYENNNERNVLFRAADACLDYFERKGFSYEQEKAQIKKVLSLLEGIQGNNTAKNYITKLNAKIYNVQGNIL